MTDERKEALRNLAFSLKTLADDLEAVRAEEEGDYDDMPGMDEDEEYMLKVMETVLGEMHAGADDLQAIAED